MTAKETDFYMLCIRIWIASSHAPGIIKFLALLDNLAHIQIRNQCHLVKKVCTFLLSNPLFTLEIAYLLNYFCEYVASNIEFWLHPLWFLVRYNQNSNEMHSMAIQNVTINQSFSQIFQLFKCIFPDLLN